jgi:hypothetical protein
MKSSRPFIVAIVLTLVIARIIRFLWRLPITDRVDARQAEPIRAEVFSPAEPIAVTVDGAPASFVRVSPDLIEVRATAVTYERRPTNILARPLTVSDRFANVQLTYPGPFFYVRTATV